MDDKTILQIVNDKLLNLSDEDAQKFLKKQEQNVSKITSELKNEIRNNLHKGHWYPMIDKPDGTNGTINHYIFEWNGVEDTNLMNEFCSDVTMNEITRDFVVKSVGFGWGAVYENLHFKPDGDRFRLVPIKGQEKNYNVEVRNQLKRIESNETISRFEGLGIFKCYIDEIENFLQYKVDETRQPWNLIVQNIKNRKLIQYCNRHGYTDFRWTSQTISQRKKFVPDSNKPRTKISFRKT